MNALGTADGRAKAAAREAWAAVRETHDLAREAAVRAAQNYRMKPTDAAWEAWHAATVTWERARVAEGRARIVMEAALA